MTGLFTAFPIPARSRVGAATALAQTASPANRDTTIQTRGPSGASGAVGPNDNPDGSIKDGVGAKTPTKSAVRPAHHHRAPKATTTAITRDKDDIRGAAGYPTEVRCLSTPRHRRRDSGRQSREE